MSETYSAAAARLAGITGLTLGWHPDEFWRATPDELAAIFSAARPARETPPDAADLARLRELYPDG